jgi:hypothetical protein
MQRRSFLARLGALVAGAVGAKHIAAQEPDEVIIPFDVKVEPIHLADGTWNITGSTITFTHAPGDTAMWTPGPDNTVMAYVDMRGVSFTDNFIGQTQTR